MDDSKAAFAHRLNQAFDAFGVPEKQKGRYTAIAKLFSVTPVAARDWCEGRSYPSLEKLLQILGTVRRNADWLLFGRASAEDDFVIHAAEPHPARGKAAAESAPAIAFERHWLAQALPGADVELVQVAGDAMAPTLVRGDVVVLDRNIRTVADSGLFGLQAQSDGAWQIRRLRRNADDTLELICDHVAYPARIVRQGSGGTLSDLHGAPLALSIGGRVAMHLRTRID